MTVKETLAQTKKRRKSQICKVFEIKIDKSHLSKSKLKYLKILFIEAKWIYNAQLASGSIFDYSYKVKEVEVFNTDKEKETRKIKHLSSQMKQSLVDRTKQNIISLSRKKSGRGKLKFKYRINSIPLKQFGHTYRIKNKKYVKIQGFRRHFKVLGMSQIPEEAEIANANLIQKNGDFYFKITTFQAKKPRQKTGNRIGLDFGIKDAIVDSEGNKHNFNFPETRQIKKAHKNLFRKKKGSKNRYKQKLRLSKQYEKLINRKKDAKNKFVSKLVEENDLICIQDEMIHQWHKSGMKGFGRRVQYGIMGGIISDLKHKSETLVIPRSFPSTQLCPECGSLNKIGLDERTYKCPCGYSKDRDTHSAQNILNEGLKISKELRNKMPVEKKSDLIGSSGSIKHSSVKQEARIL